MQHINFNMEGQTAILTLNRPAVFNAFNREMALELQQALDTCTRDPSTRAVLLTGSGKAFCAGQDLQEIKDPAAAPSFRTILGEHYNPIIERIAAMPKPVVAAVNGVAAGAGANIALACDIVVAAASASFIQAFSKIGLVPDSGGTFFLPRLVGIQKATALMMLGDRVSADEAAQMGMIYKVYPDNDFQDAARALAQTLAQMPTRALALTKQLLQASATNSLATQLAEEDRCQAEAGASRDYQEGLAAFLEKRPPLFSGE
jgi:2-(1,2-epoxy-1,2-dihydrophenyl)acetyl-CoA isomerase